MGLVRAHNNVSLGIVVGLCCGAFVCHGVGRGRRGAGVVDVLDMLQSAGGVSARGRQGRRRAGAAGRSAGTHRMSRSWLLSGLRRLLRLAMGSRGGDQDGGGGVWVEGACGRI